MPAFKLMADCAESPARAQQLKLDSKNRIHELLWSNWDEYMSELREQLHEMPATRIIAGELSYKWLLPDKVEPFYQSENRLRALDLPGVQQIPAQFAGTRAGEFRGVWKFTFDNVDVANQFFWFATLDIGAEHSFGWLYPPAHPF